MKGLARDFFSQRSKDGSSDVYVHVNIGSTELSANHNIKQMVDVVQKSEKVRVKLSRVEFAQSDIICIVIL